MANFAGTCTSDNKGLLLLLLLLLLKGQSLRPQLLLTQGLQEISLMLNLQKCTIFPLFPVNLIWQWQR